MNQKHIQIDVFRVSPDSQYLDLMLQCPGGYLLNYIQIKVDYFVKDQLQEKFYDVTDAILDSSSDRSKVVARIPLSAIFTDKDILKGVYTMNIKALNSEDDDVIEDIALCSDVRGIYTYILDNILSLKDDCSKISEEAIRNYLILFGHERALSDGDICTALEYYKILSKNFSKCNNSSRSCFTGSCCHTNVSSNNCGC